VHPDQLVSDTNRPFLFRKDFVFMHPFLIQDIQMALSEWALRAAGLDVLSGCPESAARFLSSRLTSRFPHPSARPPVIPLFVLHLPGTDTDLRHPSAARQTLRLSCMCPLLSGTIAWLHVVAACFDNRPRQARGRVGSWTGHGLHVARPCSLDNVPAACSANLQ
jgi:hypothetical protein